MTIRKMARPIGMNDPGVGWGEDPCLSFPTLCLTPYQAVCSASFPPPIHVHVSCFIMGQEGRASSTSLVPLPPGCRPFGVISIDLFLSDIMEFVLVMRL